MGEVSDCMREGGGELSSVSDIVVGRTSATLPGGCGSPRWNRSTHKSIRSTNDGHSNRPATQAQDVKRRQIIFRSSIYTFSGGFELSQTELLAPHKTGEEFLTRTSISLGGRNRLWCHSPSCIAPLRVWPLLWHVILDARSCVMEQPVGVTPPS